LETPDFLVTECSL